ncbi:protein ORF10 [Cyprinid herpesvirus 1]|uniref:Protein ORF10 n=1 Tax=Cyprinid herpesvirus 1 TaxID=317858 RepID=K7PCJ6_9VIRU|nr:protein ORF10 [Cyprinid herpesvirus 1]AFJ20320.1 protein ORF10 [Cyprinid herpesvirus 1]
MSSPTPQTPSTQLLQKEWQMICGVSHAPWTCRVIPNKAQEANLTRFTNALQLYSGKATLDKTAARLLSAMWSALSPAQQALTAWEMAGVLDRCTVPAYSTRKALEMPACVRRCLLMCSGRTFTSTTDEESSWLCHRRSTPLCCRGLSLLAYQPPTDCDVETIKAFRTSICVSQLVNTCKVLQGHTDLSVVNVCAQVTSPQLRYLAQPETAPIQPGRDSVDCETWVKWALSHFPGGSAWASYQCSPSAVAEPTPEDVDFTSLTSQPQWLMVADVAPPTPPAEEKEDEEEIPQVYDLAQMGHGSHVSLLCDMDDMDYGAFELADIFLGTGPAAPVAAVTVADFVTPNSPRKLMDVDELDPATPAEPGLDAIHPCSHEAYPRHVYESVSESEAEGHSEPKDTCDLTFGPVRTVAPQPPSPEHHVALLEDGETLTFVVPVHMIDVHYWGILMDILMQSNVPEHLRLTFMRKDLPMRRGTLRARAGAMVTLQARSRAVEMCVPSGASASGMLQMWQAEGHIWEESVECIKPILRCPYHLDEENTDIPITQVARLCFFLRHINHWLDGSENHPKHSGHVRVRRQQGLAAELLRVSMDCLSEKLAPSAFYASHTPTPNMANMICTGYAETPDASSWTPQDIQDIPVLGADALSLILQETLMPVQPAHYQPLQQQPIMPQCVYTEPEIHLQSVASVNPCESRPALTIAETARFTSELTESALEVMNKVPQGLTQDELSYDPRPVQGAQDARGVYVNNQSICLKAPLDRKYLPSYNKDPSCAFYIPMHGVDDPSNIPGDYYKEFCERACQYEERTRYRNLVKQKAFNMSDAMAYPPTHFAAAAYGSGPFDPNTYHDVGNAFRYHEKHFLPPINNTYDTIKRRATGAEQAALGAQSLETLVANFWGTHPEFRVKYDELVTLLKTQNLQPKFLKQVYAHAGLNPSDESPAAIKLSSSVTGCISDQLGFPLFFLSVEYFGSRAEQIVWWARTHTLRELLTEDFWARFITLWGCHRKMVMRLATADLCSNVRSAVRANRHVPVPEFHKQVSSGLQAVTRMHAGILPYMGETVPKMPAQPIHLRPYADKSFRDRLGCEEPTQKTVKVTDPKSGRSRKTRVTVPSNVRKPHTAPFFLPDKTLMLNLKRGNFVDEYAFFPIRATTMRDMQSLGFDPKAPSRTCNSSDNAAAMNLTNIVYCKNTNQEIASNNKARKDMELETTKGLAQCEGYNVEPRIRDLPCELMGSILVTASPTAESYLTPYPEPHIYKSLGRGRKNPLRTTDVKLPDVRTCSFAEITAYMEPIAQLERGSAAFSSPSPGSSYEPPRRRRRKN